jgi:hypothetical protein
MDPSIHWPAPTGLKEPLPALLASLDTIASALIPPTLPFLFCCLDHEERVIRERACGIIKSIFRGLRTKGALLRAFRPVYITAGQIEGWWRHFEYDTYIVLLATASCSGNGYAREQAVNVLAEARDAMAIRFLLFRLSDWVKEVRVAAERGIRKYMEPRFHLAFVKEMVEVERLLNVQRAPLGALYRDILFFIVDVNLTAALLRVADSGQSKRLLVRHYLRYKGMKPWERKLILTHSNCQVRLALLDYALALPDSERISIYRSLLKDRCTKVRQAVLEHCEDCPPLQLLIDRQIDDRSPAIRQLARQHVEQREIKRVYDRYPLRDEKMTWANGQAAFVLHVLTYHALGVFTSEDGEPLTADEVGKLFLHVYEVDLSPYTDFHSLRVSMPAQSVL